MIDWLEILYHALWILGLATLLATLSLTHWLAGEKNRSFSQSLSEPSIRLAIVAGIILFALGLMLIVKPWEYKIAWLVLLLLALWEGLNAWRDG